MGRFSAATPRSARAVLHGRWPPFSRSYGVKLPSSLAKVLPFTWVVSYQPTSVGLRYGRTGCSLEAFLGGTGAGPSAGGCPPPSRRASGCMCRGISLPAPPTRADERCPVRCASVPLRVPPSLIAPTVRCRNLDLLSIDYALRPRLRSDFPWVDHPAPGTLGLAVAGILTLLSRYSYRHSLWTPLHPRSRSGFAGDVHAPLPRVFPPVRGVGGGLEPRYILGAAPLDQ